jgi:hypothetical protein
MSKVVRITIEPSGSATLAAYCLKTDSWNDYLAFKEDAKQAIAQADQRNANRFFRAALICLFMHMEAVVEDIESHCVIPSVYPGGRLCDKTRNIAEEARKYGEVPYMN